jgi:hypothetical protein
MYKEDMQRLVCTTANKRGNTASMKTKPMHVTVATVVTVAPHATTKQY